MKICHVLRPLGISFLIGLSPLLASGEVPTPLPAALSGKWNAKMQSLYVTLAELLTNISSDRRFNDPKLKKSILAQSEKLASLAHQLTTKNSGAPDGDPTLQVISGLLAGETKEAVTALKRDNREYARSILRTVPSYCISCHTRNDTGVQFKSLALEPTAKTMSALELGEFYGATRQFDRSIEQFMKIIEDPKAAEKDHWGWKRTVEQALTIAVRAKKDSKLAEKIVDAVITSKSAPAYMKLDAAAWKKSIQEWNAETATVANTPEGLRTEAMRLMAKAKDAQRFSMDRSADVLYLRASAATHDLLQVAKEDRTVADGLFMAGWSYEVLNPLKRENMHQIYYEACVRKLPHTPTSELCYARFEENVILGYTGSGGTSVPESVRERMNQLETLAQPNPTLPRIKN